ncbi:hypothetical protein CASFOL_020347 [Castilleja foliolosa]|uniref:Mediator complex subunit 15 KIX domain-containing protein n=1 Tax=Castilleja foliolosa TaxID=1961234 RepID=A0ABD3D4B4_9LAMI
MDSNNWRASPGMEGGDWRTQFQPDCRQRIVNKIMETLKRHLPFSGQEGLQELQKIAVRFEEKIYTTATSEQDYLRKISLKMLTMEPNYQNPIANSLQSNNPFSEPIQNEAHLTYEPTQLQEAFNAMTINPPDDAFYMDTGATSHLSADQNGHLLTRHNSSDNLYPAAPLTHGITASAILASMS